MRNCDLCNAEQAEFTVTSKHLSSVLRQELRVCNTTGTSHITKHICENCFLKIFGRK